VLDRNQGSALARALLHSPLFFKALICKAQNSSAVLGEHALPDMVKQLELTFESRFDTAVLDGDMDGLSPWQIGRAELLREIHSRANRLPDYIAMVAVQLSVTPAVCASVVQEIDALNVGHAGFKSRSSSNNSWCTKPLHADAGPPSQKGYQIALAVIITAVICLFIIRRRYRAAVAAANGDAQPKPESAHAQPAQQADRPISKMMQMGIFSNGGSTPNVHSSTPEQESRRSDFDEAAAIIEGLVLSKSTPVQGSRRMSVDEAAAIIEGKAVAVV
jgi:hypothetical protein